MTLTAAHIKTSTGFNAGVLRGFAKAAIANGVDPDTLLKSAQALSFENVNKLPAPAAPETLSPALAYTESGLPKTTAFKDVRMQPLTTDPKNPLGALYKPTAAAPGISRKTPLPAAVSGLRIRGPNLSPEEAGVSAELQDRRSRYLQKALDTARWRHQRSGSAETFDPRKHFSIADLGQIYEAESSNPLTPVIRDVGRGVRIAGAGAETRIRNWIRGLSNLPPQQDMEAVKNRWFGGGSAKDLYNPMSRAYQRVWGADPEKTMLAPPVAGPASGSVPVRDASGRLHYIKVPFLDPEYKMVDGQLTHRSLLPNRGEPIPSRRPPPATMLTPLDRLVG